MHSFVQTPRQFSQNTDNSFRCCRSVKDSLQSLWTTTMKTTTTTSQKRLKDEYNDHVTITIVGVVWRTLVLNNSVKTATTTSHKWLRDECNDYNDYYVSFVPLKCEKKIKKLSFLIRNCRSLIIPVVQVVVFSMHPFTFVSFVKIWIFLEKK